MGWVGGVLSYRHSFHAGNFADVLKHIVLVELLAYQGRKDKGFTYIDTHAGAGRFDLNSEHATKLDEWRQGVGRLSREDWPELDRYFAVLDAVNPQGGLSVYPGSPAIAQQLLREQDRGVLFELHPRDFELLDESLEGDGRFVTRKSDGFSGLISALPPPSRRAVVLMDPPYEVKVDYETVVETLIAAHAKFPSGTYALWYPVVERSRVDQMTHAFLESGIRDIQRFEIKVRPDGAGGMTGAGMFVLNPPWTLRDKLQPLLAKLAETLGVDGAGTSTTEIISPE